MIGKLFCLGLGYSARAFITACGGRIGRIAGTVRSEAGRHAFTGQPVEVLVYDGEPRADVADAIKTADALLVSAPPARLAVAAAALLGSGRSPAVVYLSSLSVYGDHGGAEIDETAALRAASARGRERIAAEEAWRQFGRDTGSPVAILRLAGIYGPGRNALLTVARGQAKRIVKPGQVFNRIHVHDIAQAIEAAYRRQADGVFNICDDMPAPGQDLVTHAAELLGIAPPPEQDYEAIRETMSPMARGFYTENKRVRNARMKAELGVTPAYPTYREGLRALLADVRAGE